MNVLFGVSLAFLAGAAVIQSEQSASAEVAPAVAQNSESGSIIMFRGSGVWGAALGCPLRYKGREIVELGRGKYAKWAVPAGRYILVNGTASVEVSVMAGETRYV